MYRTSFFLSILAALVIAGAGTSGCGNDRRSTGSRAATGTDAASDTKPAPIATAVDAITPGTPVTLAMSPTHRAQLAALSPQLDAVKDLDAAGFAARYELPFSTDLGYDPLAAKGLDLVQGSSLSLTSNEQEALKARGFVLTDRKRFPSFGYGYQTIYTEDLPVYVSADSIMYAVHKSFDGILKAAEWGALVPALDRMLGAMHSALKAGGGSDLPAVARQDVDLYVAVARSLLGDQLTPPVLGGDATAAKHLFDAAKAASGSARVTLFGIERDVDFSQFTPRGHYADDPQLERYFRATMWLGRIDFRLIETQPDHSQLFHRRQLEGAYVIRALMNQAAVDDWKMIDGTIGAFVGEPDNMTLPELGALLADLGLSSAAELGKRTDQEIAQAIVDGGYGTQRIASHIMVNGLAEGTMPLSSTFLLLGQRYVLDSHVFSNVVYDRVKRGTVQRMMPNPLDVGFAALHNDNAGLLLGAELAKFEYAPDLASMRVLAEAHPTSFWEANLYNHWLTALRTLSPTPDVANPSAVGLPRVAGTEAWSRRLLSTQLASWAELRHDTILYAKQSYTSAASCEYPDAYIEPYPELFARLAAFATRGSELLGGVELPGPRGRTIGDYFIRLRDVVTRLEKMAKEQRTGAPHSAEDLAFINHLTVQHRGGCGGPPILDGWYAKLFFNPDDALEADPIIADVHTQPTDESGNTVGKVLHVGAGAPRTMVVSIESCSGPRAYVGLVSSYFETVTDGFERLTDEEAAKNARLGAAVQNGAKSGAPSSPIVPWMTNLIER